MANLQLGSGGPVTDFVDLVDLHSATLPSATLTPAQGIGLAANLASYVFAVAFVSWMFKKGLELSFGK